MNIFARSLRCFQLVLKKKLFHWIKRTPYLKSLKRGVRAFARGSDAFLCVELGWLYLK